MTLNDLIRKAAEIRDRFSSADLTLIDACQGRRVKDITLDPYAESGQYKVLVTFETEDPATRPTAAERVAKVRADLERRGLDPFKDKSRRMMTVAMRQCVFLMLRREGYTQRELGVVPLQLLRQEVRGRQGAVLRPSRRCQGQSLQGSQADEPRQQGRLRLLPQEQCQTTQTFLI